MDNANDSIEYPTRKQTNNSFQAGNSEQVPENISFKLLAFVFLLIVGMGIVGVLFTVDRKPDEPEAGPIKEGFLSSTLGSNMVLQRDEESTLWGFSAPGTSVSTTWSISNETFSTVTDSEGIWRQRLPAMPASMEPLSILIEAPSTGESALLTNVLFGDVYICGGQSNMQFSIPANNNATEEAAIAENYPHIRFFTVGQGTSSVSRLRDLQTIEQGWSVANSQSITGPRRGFTYFSAVCWFFGRTVADGLDNAVPIGLISDNWGGTKVEYWSTPASLASCPATTTGIRNTKLYNSMINPYTIGPMAITGFTWYQGEANTKDQNSATEYACLFPAMIDAWREAFAKPNVYFGFIQLSVWCPHDPVAVAEMRQAQMAAYTTRSNIGYATNADHGMACNIHPRNKKPCGIRLGRSALALVYDQTDIDWKSPSYHSSSGALLDDLVVVDVQLADVTSELEVLSTPYNAMGGALNCTTLIEGTCAWASIQVLFEDTAEKAEWLDAHATAMGSQARLVAKLPAGRVFKRVVGSNYGWGAIPMLTLYDSKTKLPVLPWNEKAEDTIAIA